MRFIRLSIVAGTIMVISAGLISPASAGTRTYRTVDLGTLGGVESTARAINNRGQVVGDSETGDHEIRPFLWQRGRMIDLGDLGGFSARAYAINDRGQVVGSSELPSGEEYGHHAFLWQRGVMTDLGTLGGPISTASGINDRGQIVGISLTAEYAWHAFLWQRGVMTDLGPFEAGAINNRGEIVGTGGGHAVRWRHGTLFDLGAPTERGTAVNDAGAVLIRAADSEHAFVWRRGALTDIGTLGGPYSWAFDMNNRGQIVGTSSLTDTPPMPEHAFLWQRGRMTDLTARGLDESAFVVAINDNGRLAGSSDGHAALFS